MSWDRDFLPWLVSLAGMATLLWLFYWMLAPGKTVVREFIYKETPEANLDIRLFLPSDWAPHHQRPAILFFFGGGWIGGGIDHFKWQADVLAREGMVAALVDYRVDSRHHTTPDAAVADGFDAFNWLLENANRFGIDPKKIISSGSSAGGHIAACLALCTPPQGVKTPKERPALLVLFNPVLDLTNATPELEFSPRELELIAMMSTETVAAISPNLHVDNHTPPSLLIFGDLDPLTRQGEQFSRMTEAAGVETRTEIFPKQKHGFFNREPWRSETLEMAERFLTKHNMLPVSPNE